MDKQLAADLLSEVFIKVMKNMPKYEIREAPFSAWLYRITINQLNEYYRKTKKIRMVAVEETDVSSLVEEVIEDEQDHVTNLKLLKHSMNGLKQKDLQLIELRFFEKKSFIEIGVIMGLTANNAKISTYRAIDKLRKKMLK